ncbi:MAG: triose-phosphate isomerase [Dehalococcoidales bacterium]
MRIPFIAGNWKMNITLSEAVELVGKMLKGLDAIDGVEKVLCPPFISLATVRELIRGSSIKLGAQNLFYEEKGAYTGEISPLMLADLCQFVIIGHSERRQYFNETGEIINKKVKAALKVGLTPVLCIGEKLAENRAGRTQEVVTGQLNSALAGVDSLKGTVIAYEPVWAIGTGLAASGEQANETAGLIRHNIADLYDEETARNLRILYGGSVKANNIAEYVGQPEIDGALVGGACIQAESFLGIVRQTQEAQGNPSGSEGP